jgi:hypothetical protein
MGAWHPLLLELLTTYALDGHQQMHNSSHCTCMLCTENGEGSAGTKMQVPAATIALPFIMGELMHTQ